MPYAQLQEINHIVRTKGINAENTSFSEIENGQFKTYNYNKPKAVADIIDSMHSLFQGVSVSSEVRKSQNKVVWSIEVTDNDLV